MKWYEAKHVAELDDTMSQFNWAKPPKDINDRIDQTREYIADAQDVLNQKVESSALDFSIVID